MSKKQTVSWILVVFALLGPAVFAQAGDPSKIEERVAAWEKAFNAGDAAAIAALYTEDAKRLPYQAPALQGWEAISGNIRETYEQGIVSIDLALTGSETYGMLAWASGTYALMDGDGNVLQKGKWMNVSKKVGKNWKIHADIWNTDAPE